MSLYSALPNPRLAPLALDNVPHSHLALRDGSLLPPDLKFGVDASLNCRNNELPNENSQAKKGVEIFQGQSTNVPAPSAEDNATRSGSLENNTNRGAFRKYIASFGIIRLIVSFILVSLKSGIDKASRK